MASSVDRFALRKLVGVKAAGQGCCDKTTDQFFKALPHSSECHWSVVVEARDVGFLGQGDYKYRFQAGWDRDCARDWLKIFVRIPAGWSAQSFSIQPGTLSGPATFLGLMARCVRLTSCSSIVRFMLLCGVVLPSLVLRP